MRGRVFGISIRRAGLGAVLALLAVSGWWLARGDRNDEDAGWVDIRREDLILGVEVTGTLKAVDSSLLGPPQVAETWNYKISFLAPEGKEVKKGEPVLGFDTTELQRKLEQKQAESAAARKQIEKKEVDVSLRGRQAALRLAEAEARERKASLKLEVPENLKAAHDLQQAKLDLGLAREEIVYLKTKAKSEQEADRADLQSLRNQRDRAEQRVQEIQDAIRKMTVTAPRDGTVIYVTDWRGDKNKVGDTAWRGEKILEIPDLRKMMAKGDVDEADSGKIAEGQAVTLRLDAHPDVVFKGRAASIWKTVQRRSEENELKVVRLDITLADTDPLRMRPGMRFRGTIETGRIGRLLVIPADAVFPTSDGPIAYRRTLTGFEAVSVKLGRRNEKLVEILGGLREKDSVARRDLGADRRGPA